MVVDTVALPIEQQVNGVEDMLYMQSTSAADGTYNLIVTFKIGTDLDFAQVLVQNRVSSALSQLPDAVQAQGVTVQKKSTAILMFVTLTSPDRSRDSLFLANYGTISLRDELSRVSGVGNVNVFGAGQYSMRIWLDPNKLYGFDLTPQDVIGALRSQSQEVAAGQIGIPPVPNGQDFQYTIDITGRLNQVEQYENVVVKTGSGAGGQFIRIKDVGRVELGAQTYSQIFTQDGQPAAALGIFQTPGANALQVKQLVSAKMDELAKAFPTGVQYQIPFDTTKFVNASINEVYRTLIEAAVLVLIVILIFLQDWRAMLVPATTVPVTIIGAFAGMWALGFTVNLSTLFAIVLAIGIVVDDAIVVVEGAAHNIERGLSGHDAAIKAMDELFGPIIGITLVLMSVFIPAAFLPGLTGQMYAQFALVIAATALLSAINAATLKPTQCALWLRPAVPPEQRNFFFRGFNRVYSAFERGYVRLIGGDGAPCRRRRRGRADDHRCRRLRPVAHSDRLPADRGPGLSAGDRAIAGRCIARANQRRVATCCRDCPQGSRRREHAVDRRRLRAGQQRDACQFRRDLHHPERLERARQGRAIAAVVHQALARIRSDHGGEDRRPAAAADPGHRQCRRLHHDGAVARRFVRLHQAAGHHQPDRQQRAVANRIAARADVVPRRRAAAHRRGRPRQGANFVRAGQCGVRGDIELSRFDLCRAVQQVRPHLPGLCAG